ncbi:MAG: Spy/CpxP family protein refolding chaperone [Planctomycetota bacterium]
MNAHRFRSWYLSRTVPTAAGVLMIASGIALAQSASEPAPTPPEASAEVSPEADRSDEARREQRRERRRQFMEQRGEGQGSPTGRMEGKQRGDDGQGRGGPGGPNAEGGQRGKAGQGLRMLMRDVNPTDEQQEQIRAIVREATGPMQQYMADNAEAMRAARDAMQQARADRDREAGQAAMEQLRALRDAGPKVDREALSAQVRAVLNEGQQAVYDANLAELKQHQQEREARRQERMEQRGERGEAGERSQRKQRRGGPDAEQTDAPADDQLDL